MSRVFRLLVYFWYTARFCFHRGCVLGLWIACDTRARHLLYGSHVILPHLVEGLLRMCSTRNIASPVLVGASAWGAHLPAVPIDTEDLDFVLDARDERVDAGLVRDLLHGAIDHAVCHVAVQWRLAVLHGVRAATHRHGHPPRSTTADGASTKYSAELVVAVRAAEDCQHPATVRDRPALFHLDPLVMFIVVVF
eukprot:m.1427208 g.1427208  ORF g.1427208 m.1427208 type:complete len:194 (-) comp25065_c0_seq64:2513-3094(-)